MAGWRWECPVDVGQGFGAHATALERTKHEAEAAYAAHYKAAHPRPAARTRSGEYAVLEPFPGTTVADAKRWLDSTIDGGAKCPCCAQVCKVYRRTLHSSMVRQLVGFYSTFGVNVWGRRPDWAQGRAEGDFAKLRYWGFVEESTETREDGGRAGWWRVTVGGERFVRAELLAPKYVRIFDARALGFDGPQVDVHEALGQRFHLNELLGRAV